MRAIRRASIYALTTAAALVAAIATASAACTIAGTWHVFLIQAQTPDIRMETATVGNSSNNGATQVRVFDLNEDPFDNHTAAALKCTLTLKANGTINGTGPCNFYGVVPGDTGATTVRGRFIFGAGANACMIAGGTVTVTGDPIPVNVLGGYVNGNNGAGIMRQGTGSVLLFNMVKR